ncbi:MAG TPA: AAA family ATPase, partial [Chlamydiales bacterium]|nr:AAA family ATPase [Chlamydiales bacterium]
AADATRAIPGQLLGELGTIFSKFDAVGKSGEFAKIISDSLGALIKNLKISKLSGQVGQEFSGGFEAFWDALNLGDVGNTAGAQFEDLFKGFSKPLGEGLVGAMDNINGKLMWNFLYHYFPYILGATVTWYAAPLTVQYIYQRLIHAIGRPKLATEIRQLGMLAPITSRIHRIASSIFGWKDQTKPVYNKELTERIEEISQATENTRKNGGYFQNVLFYGPGGTGKTMISSYIAEKSGMSYIKMSGADLGQYIKRGEHITELNKIMDKMESWRPWSRGPWILFIDEAESLCRDRNKLPTQELLELQNSFLNRTGTQSKNFMLILSTNRMEDLDEAVLSRMDHKVYIGPPGEKERAEILNTYIPQFFSKNEQGLYFKSAQVQAIAAKTEGLTGRSLFKMLNTLATKKMSTKDNKLTLEMIDKTIRDFVNQEQEVEQRRAKKEANLSNAATNAAWLRS